MSIVKKDIPDKGELVLVQIKKIMPYGAYCELTEFNMDAYLPIAEVASGWIKNIHEFIKEGQKDVAKVVFIDIAKKAVDVSLKKVSAKEKKEKINEVNLENRAMGIFNQAITASGSESKKATILKFISENATTYTGIIEDVSTGKDPLANLKDENFKQKFYELALKSIKPKIYSVSYTVELHTYDGKGGITMIKDIFSQIEKIGIKVLYVGAPNYRIVAEGNSYHTAEGKIKEAQTLLEQYPKKFVFSLKSNRVQN